MPVELASEQDALLQEILEKFRVADEAHKVERTKWDELDALYHSSSEFSKSLFSSGRDQQGVYRDGQKLLGIELFIPYSYATVETVLPRLLSNRPRPIITPRSQRSERNVENLKFILDAQQQKANYELKLQTTVRTALKLGIGVQKLAWRREEVQKTRLKKRMLLPGYAEENYTDCPWDDPDVQDVSPYDFLWDPYADCMESAGYVFHRNWRSTEYVLAMFEAEKWDQFDDVTREDVEGISGKQWYQEIWNTRKRIQGARTDLRGSIHEVLEFHDGNRVVTVVDRAWPVATARNPAWHKRKPFYICRPTEIEHQFSGKGVIEPMRSLQLETNTLRSNRLWNAMLKLHVAHFFEEGTLDPAEVEIFPGALIPVNGPPRDLLHPVVVGNDIPGSSYQEDAALLAAIERTTGISDPVAGTGDASQTATGVQLVQAAAGVRIQLQSRRVELELVKAEGEDWIELNQQRILEARDMATPMSPEPGQPDRRWAWKKIGPEEIAGEFAFDVDGGSMAPENVPQDRQDAQIMLQLSTNPDLDGRRVMMLALRKLGIKEPELYMAPERIVPPQTLDILMRHLTEDMGIEPDQAHEVIAQALNEAHEADDEARVQGQQLPGQPPAAPEGQMAA